MRDAGNYYRQYEYLKIVLVAIRAIDQEVVYCIKWPAQATWHTIEEIWSSVPEEECAEARRIHLPANHIGIF